MQNVIPNLLTWYKKVHRKLPWRETSNPYYIWVSEVILQQTRVEQGREYYLKFVDKFPDIFSLARAEESEILKIWQGLGYYARARNMHFAAKQMVDLHQGNFPNDYFEIKNLRGIGDYTAAAIASFAFKQHYPAIDGNVKRVTARFYGIDLPISSPGFYKLVEKELFLAIKTTEPDIFNQAMIELGAMVCTPVNPKCDICPIQSECVAFKFDKTLELPNNPPKKKPIRKYLHFFYIEAEGHLVLQQRPSEGIWGGLNEFPCIESLGVDEIPENMMEYLGLENGSFEIVDNFEFKHLLTHQTIFAKLWHIKVNTKNILTSKNWNLIKINDIRTFPLHKLMVKILDKLHL